MERSKHLLYTRMAVSFISSPPGITAAKERRVHTIYVSAARLRRFSTVLSIGRSIDWLSVWLDRTLTSQAWH